MKRIQGFSLVETMVVLAIALVGVAAVAAGFSSYRRQSAVVEAVELVNAVQRSASQQDETLPLDVTALINGVDERFRSVDPVSGAVRLHGVGGSAAAIAAGSAGGFELHLAGVDPRACAEMVSRVWPLVDGVSAGKATSGQFAPPLVALKRTSLGEAQALPSTTSLNKACLEGGAPRTVVLAVAGGFPPAPIYGGSAGSSGDETIELPPPPPPPDEELM